MNNSGETILKAVRQMKQLYGDVSSLLQSAGGHMMEAGWKAYGSTAIAQTSAAIYNPSQWLPSNAFTFFTNKDSEHLLAYVSVILDDMDGAGDLEAPLVTAGYLEYDRPEGVGGDWCWWYARRGEWEKELPVDGEFHVLTPDSDWETECEKKGIQETGILMLRLVEVTDEEELHTKVTSRLIAVLKSKVLDGRSPKTQ